MKRIAFQQHGSSYKMKKIIEFSDILEDKFNEISFIKTKKTVLGNNTVRLKSFNTNQRTFSVLLPHKYSKSSKKVKIIIGIKDMPQDKIEKFILDFDKWLKSYFG